MQVTLDTKDNMLRDPSATLFLHIETVEKGSEVLKCVGYATLAVFHDPLLGTQPQRHNISDYVLNQV